MGATTPRA
jgi:hypothetical protein